jgi:hypothetical protein
MKFFFIAYFIFCTMAHGNDLIPSEDSCSFYLHLENKRPCIKYTNYPVFYGYKYCSLFGELKTRWRPALAAWVSQTALCLQQKLADYEIDNSDKNDEDYCYGLEKAAFSSHAECYATHGFCSLSYAQQMRIVYHLTNLDILLKPKSSLQQALKLAVQCASENSLSCNLL